MFLTQDDGLIVGPIARLMGWILEGLYDLLNNLGIVTIGVAIILFTLIIRLCLFPMMFKQSKSTKISQYIQPEINKVTKKYKGKKDQESMLAQQQEVRKIQEKYGVSLSAGCLQSIIQLPIFFALYAVIRNIPAYVSKVKDLYLPIANKIAANQAVFDKFVAYNESEKINAMVKPTIDNTNSIIDILSKVSDQEAWTELSNALANTDVTNAINANVDKITDIYSFIGGINLAAVPGFALTTAILIPILSMVFQFLSLKASPSQSTAGASNDPTAEATMKSMKTMLMIMPVFSFFVTVNVPAGLGLYWATGSLVSFLTSVLTNTYFKYCDMEKVVEKSKNKAAKKIEKKKKSGKKSFMDKLQEAAYGAPEENNTSKSTIASTSLKNYTSNTMNKNASGVKYRENSLAAKANIMERYNDKNK